MLGRDKNRVADSTWFAMTDKIRNASSFNANQQSLQWVSFTEASLSDRTSAGRGCVAYRKVEAQLSGSPHNSDSSNCFHENLPV